MMLRLLTSRPDSPIRSDRDLLLAVRDGDERALDEVIKRKTRALVQVAWRVVGDLEEAKDIAQMTFVRLWEKRQRYDERYSPNTWMYRIATNLAIDALRSRQCRDRAAEPVRLHLVQRGAATGRNASGRAAEREVAGIFVELAETLSERQRTIFVLRELEGFSSAEVAEIVGCQESTVRNHLFNARRTLRRELLARYPEYGPQSSRRGAQGSSEGVEP